MLERIGIAASRDDHIQDTPPLEMRDHEQRFQIGQVLAGRIIGIDDRMVDDPRLAGVQQLLQQPTVVDRQQLGLFPGIDMPLPHARARDAEFRRLEAAPAQRHPAIAGQQLPHPGRVRLDHFLRIAGPAHLAHHGDDIFEPLLPRSLSQFEGRCHESSMQENCPARRPRREKLPVRSVPSEFSECVILPGVPPRFSGSPPGARRTAKSLSEDD